MWINIKIWIKSVSDFLVAHPSIKALLDGLGKCVVGAAIAYLGPLLDPHNVATFTTSGLGVAVMGAVKAWLQYNHDKILAVVQDNVMASPADVPVINSAVLTPVVPTTTTK